MDIGRAYPANSGLPSEVTWPADLALSVEKQSATTPPLLGPVLEDYLTRLIAALADTAKQLSRAADSMQAMAQSNQALIAAMAEADGMDDMQPESYMDGSKVR